MVFAISSTVTGEETRRPEPPNFILIFTDDQGYRDIGCFGSTTIRTPNLDRMAREGMRFTDFYSASSVCSPSRAALLTGSYPPRAGVTRVLFPRDRVGLHPGELTVAEVLREKGYATACIGKWHLGHHPEFLPTRHGFDHYFGIPYSNDMKLDPGADFHPDADFRDGQSIGRVRGGEAPKNMVPLMVDEKVVEYPADQSSLTRRYTDRAISFIRQNQSRPFFLYLPHTMPHIPLFASRNFLGQSAGGLYGDTIEEIDWNVGRLMDVLRQLNLDRSTLVIYTSDNGPWNLKNGHGGDAFPLRGYKFSTLEGGMRVPCIMRWPGQIPAGGVCHELAGTIDILPTLASLAGASLPADRVIDGKNILPLMRGEPGARSPHEAYYYYRGTTPEAVRSGPWKLRVTGGSDTPRTELYHLDTDISEANNLATANPDTVARLKSLMDGFHGRLMESRRPTGSLD